ncbi:MAG TPA: shikimate dehydrogenase [Candidatus Avipropionibacterium avicola]|uniref:Shikimate dehydrogenase n=1 Tax=Candidatus Avipropionibacterium avicola TaxID=2840701 RepID=A0A9D1GYD3_9ACTN|nr:shikimate dehydrogenase [Candidatus Avipropionibacterium avicola]
MSGDRICAVLGSPIDHSLSPELHRAAYRELGLDWSYQRHRVEESELAGFVAGLDPRWRGLSLTMPLKVVALDLGEPDELVTRVGAANTLVLGWDGEPHRLHNTDVGGLVGAIRATGVDRIERAVVLGSGATTRSTLASLALLGCQEVTVIARTPAKAEALAPLAEACGLRLRILGWGAELSTTDLLVSTVTAGAADAMAPAAAERARLVFDVLYDPWPTVLAQQAEARGVPVVSGLDLLAHQAVEQVELMTGQRVDPAVLVATGRAALAARAG